MMRLSGWIILLQTALIKQIFFFIKRYFFLHTPIHLVFFFSTSVFDESGITILITI